MYPFSTADIHAPAADTAAVITYAASTGFKHTISGIAWSYSADPTGGQLTVEDGSGTVVFRVAITTGGPGVIYFDPPRFGTVSTALIITLAAGGGAVVGKVNTIGYWKSR